MNDPIKKLRELFEKREAMNSLKEFAEKSEFSQLENDWREFVDRAVAPAFSRVDGQSFSGKCQPLPKEGYPGFRLKDGPNSEFWFWIELRGRTPVAKARRKFGDSGTLSVVSTPDLCVEADFDLTKIMAADIEGAVFYAYEKSFFDR